MTQTKNILNIAGKKIDTYNYLQTLQPDNIDFSAKINVTNYSNLGNIINSLIGICQTALIMFSENSELSESQKENILGSSSLDINNVLEIAKNLIPYADLNY